VVAETVVAGHQAGSAITAQERVALDQQRIGSAACGRGRRDDAARPATGHHYLVPLDDGRFKSLRILVRRPARLLGRRAR
jgi:hypothetical protein